jgi:hypothetical protein
MAVRSGSSASSQPPNPQGGDHPPGDALRLGEVGQQCPAVDEVVRLVLQVVSPDVVPPHLDVRQVEILQEARIDVSGNHLSGRSDP